MDRIYYQGVFDMSIREEAVVGGRELDDILQTLAPKLQKNVQRTALRAGAAVFLREVKSRIPAASGQLRASARVTSRAQGGTVYASVKVGNFVAWYAHLVEFGTRSHYIWASAADRGAGRGRGRRGTAGRRETLASMSTVNRRVLQIGGHFIGPGVHHPGARAHPFMRPAADVGFPEAVRAYTAKMRQRLTRQGLNTPGSPTP